MHVICAWVARVLCLLPTHRCQRCSFGGKGTAAVDATFQEAQCWRSTLTDWALLAVPTQESLCRTLPKLRVQMLYGPALIGSGCCQGFGGAVRIAAAGWLWNPPPPGWLAGWLDGQPAETLPPP